MRPTKLVVRRLLNGLARLITGAILDVDAAQLDRLPLYGPLLIIVNHVNFLELPTIYPRIRSDLGIGFSKVENWANPIYRLLFNNWDVIPIDRDSIDITAMRKGFEALDQGRILFITPEGTRSHDGRLQQGKPGVVMMALHSGAPVWPVACYGGEAFIGNLKRLRRTEYHIAVGNPFRVDTRGERVTGAVRQRITDEMMYQMATLLPPQYRGFYSDITKATDDHLRFASPDQNNLPHLRVQ
jgi:1-acyl-sn-glycerol-3-phosphate acyltransferase